MQMTTPQRGQFEKLGDHKFSIHKVFGPKTFKVPMTTENCTRRHLIC